jgi:GT2 family glycosyltransferase
MLGIGVITYRRPHALAALLDKLKQSTTGDFKLVVADDGSGDETLAVCQAAGVPVVTGVNRGVAWNKNRALYWLYGQGCTHFVILEDDMAVTDDGWNQSWISAIDRWDHINWLAQSHIPFVTAGMFLGGSGSPDDPYVCEHLYGVCMGFSRRSLARVGFYDTRFIKYGFEHIDLTLRNRRAGLGVRDIATKDGTVLSFVMIPGGLTILDMVSGADMTAVERNRVIFQAIQGEPVYRAPWHDQEERALIEAETGCRMDLEMEHDTAPLKK